MASFVATWIDISAGLAGVSTRFDYYGYAEGAVLPAPRMPSWKAPTAV